MRVVFLGNHTIGVRVLQVMRQEAEVVGVVAHPPDPEDGVRYESVFDFARQCGWNTIRGKGKDPQTLDFVSAARPDLLWITDYRYLIPQEIIVVAPLGAVNLHPSLLPVYRGRASVNWAILNGETTLGLTAHFVDAGMDSGDIIEQVSYELGEDQDVGDALNILYPLYASMTKRILAEFQSGKVPRVPQDQSRATVFPRRRPEDGVIDWKRPARAILNLVRAVAAPYPGAFTTMDGKKLTVWKARIVSETGSGSAPGCIVEVDQSVLLVQCGQGILALLDVEREDFPEQLGVGCRLGS